MKQPTMPQEGLTLQQPIPRVYPWTLEKYKHQGSVTIVERWVISLQVAAHLASFANEITLVKTAH